MNFELNNTQKDLQNTMAAFCHTEILPGAASLDTSPQDQIAVALKTNMKKLGNAGYLNLLLEDDLISQCVAGEEVAKACPATFITTMSTATAFGIPLKKFGTPSQREKCLSAIVMGDYIGGLACTEFDAGSDMNGFKTFAERKGDRWVLSGYKYLVTNATIADALLVLAWTDREDRKSVV